MKRTLTFLLLAASACSSAWSTSPPAFERAPAATGQPAQEAQANQVQQFTLANGMTLIVKPITIGDGVWVAADVFVAPGVSIGDLSVIGARSTVLKDMPAGFVCYGYPCEPRRPRTLRAPSQNATAPAC